MPVYRSEHKPLPRWEELVDAIAQELRAPTQSPDAPAIFEDDIPQSRWMNVLVIWDRFDEVPQERRGALVLEAYKKSAKQRMLQIRFANGLTPDEASRGGYLPYKVVPTIRRSDRIDQKQIRRAMEEAGAWKTPTGLELRFPYRWLAERVLATLQRRFGEHAFSLAEDVGSVGQLASIK